MKKLFLSAIAALMVVGVCLVGCGSNSISGSLFGSPTATTKDFMEAVSSMDVKAVANCVDSKSATVINSAIKLSESVMGLVGQTAEESNWEIIENLLPSAEDIDNFLSGKKPDGLTITSNNLKETVNGDKATVAGTWHFEFTSDGKTQSTDAEVSLSLVKENGAWKVSIGDSVLSAITTLFN